MPGRNALKDIPRNGVHMKKICFVLLSALLAIGLSFIPAGCGDRSSNSGTGTGTGTGTGSATGPPGTVQYGDEWITQQDMETRRAAERITLGWDFEYKIASEHYMIYSTATLDQIHEILTVAEALYTAFVGLFGPEFTLATNHPHLKVKLFKDRQEFRDVLGVASWAEGFYDGTYSNQYYDVTARNPYHWFLHEGAHQLCSEVAGIWLRQWLSEGIACYFGTSTYEGGELKLGESDVDSYPVWWADTWNLDTQIISLRFIVTGSGGPDMNTYFNYYYLHWWTLTHFLVHYNNGQYKQGFFELIRGGASLSEFEAEIGDIDAIQTKWKAYVESHIASLNF